MLWSRYFWQLFKLCIGIPLILVLNEDWNIFKYQINYYAWVWITSIILYFIISCQRVPCAMKQRLLSWFQFCLCLSQLQCYWEGGDNSFGPYELSKHFLQRDKYEWQLLSRSSQHAQVMTTAKESHKTPTQRNTCEVILCSDITLLDTWYQVLNTNQFSLSN